MQNNKDMQLFMNICTNISNFSKIVQNKSDFINQTFHAEYLMEEFKDYLDFRSIFIIIILNIN